jgi:AraC-like DNA-binding protein
VTTDQGNLGLSESLAYNLDVPNFVDPSPQTAQHVLRARCLSRGAGADSAGKPRMHGVWRSGISSDQSTRCPGRQVNTRIGVSESPTEQLFSSAHEDIARLTEILRSQQCTATMRGIDDVLVPIDTSASSTTECGRCRVLNRQIEPPRDASNLRGSTPALSAWIYDAEGRPLASLEVVHGRVDRSDSSDKLLRALIESAARSITERWFRLTHRRQWIVAALRRNAPHTSGILAVDRDQRIVAADRSARQLLEQKGRRFERLLPLSAYFQPTPALLRRRGGDASITLRGSSDGEPWITLVTPPDIGAIKHDHDARAMLHVRPRLDFLTRLLFVAPDGEGQQALSRWALKRVEEYIDAHLDTSLDIDELATLVRMSASHFTRSFHKSVGLTPHRYVVQCRVAKARELLAATDLPLTEIALTIGFSDQSHFSRRFQELVGVPPGAYRRSDVRVQR